MANKNGEMDYDELLRYAQLGRLTAAAGIRLLRPELNAWLDEKEAWLLGEAGVAPNGVHKPVRSAKTLAATEASLVALTAQGGPSRKRGRPRKDAGAEAAPVPVVKLAPGKPGMEDPAQTSARMKGWWAQWTPEQAKEIMRKRMAKRSDPFAMQVLGKPAKSAKQAKPRKTFDVMDKIDGRYTKIGAAKLLGISWKSLDYVLKTNGGVEVIRMPNGQPKTSVATYAPSDIERIAAARASRQGANA